MPLLGPDGQTIITAPDRELTASEQALADAHAALEDDTAIAPPPEAIEAQTAFVVYLLDNGQWQVSDDLDIPLMPKRKPHGDDFTSGAATVMRDVATRELAGLLQQQADVIVSGVIQTQMAMAAKAREQMEAQGIAKQIAKDQARRGR